jgi:hypothetical protein
MTAKVNGSRNQVAPVTRVDRRAFIAPHRHALRQQKLLHRVTLVNIRSGAAAYSTRNEVTTSRAGPVANTPWP